MLDTPPDACAQLYIDNPDEFKNQYVRYINEVVPHFKDRIKTWELWLEPNNNAFCLGTQTRCWTPAGYVQNLLAPGYTAIKSIDSNSIVGSGGMVFNGINGHVDREAQPPQWWIKKQGGTPRWYVVPNFLTGMYDAGAKDYMDFVNIHPFMVKYPYTLGMTATEQTSVGIYYVDPIEQTRPVRQLMQQHGDANKEIWWHPIGIPLNDTGSRTEQAEYLKKYLTAFAQYRNDAQVGPLGRLMIYTLRNLSRFGTTDAGLIDNDGNVTEAYNTLKQITTNFPDFGNVTP